MNIKDALYSEIAGTAAITALTGTTGIWRNVIPQDQGLPAVVINQVSRTGLYGIATSVFDPVAYRYQVTVYDDTEYDAVDIKDQIRIALDGFSGNMPTGSTDPVVVQAVFLDNVVEFYDPEEQTFQIAMDFLIHADE